MKTFVITGASGHIGYRIAESLLNGGAKVKIIARHREKLVPLIEKGATAFIGSLTDTEFLAKTFHKTNAVFAMIPPNPQAENVWNEQMTIGTSIAEAIRLSEVKWVVNLSSQGAHLSRKTGPIAGLHEQEERLNGITGLNIVHLRPAFFMENLFANFDLIKRKGITGAPLRGDLKIPMIATRDIARVAAEYMAELRFAGNNEVDLLGQRDLSMIETTEILGKAMAKPDLRYVQFSYADAKYTMLNMGFSADAARVFIEMYEAINEERLMHGIARTPMNTTETPFEDFAFEFARLYSDSLRQEQEGPREKEAMLTEKGETIRSWWRQLHLRRKAA